MKARIIVTLFHLLHISATSVKVPSLHSPSSSLFYVYWLSVFLSFILYFLTSFMDPGKISNQKSVSTTKPESAFHQQQSSLGSILTAASGLHKTVKNQADSKDQGEVYDANPISESLHHHDSQVDSISINLDIIQDEEEPSLSHNLKPSPIHPENQQSCPNKELDLIQNSGRETPSLSMKLESPSANISINNGPNSQDNKSKPLDDYDYVYCTACFNDQPLRARHCRQCGVCVALFDHHCPFVDNCIGEKNKFIFFWYVFIQAFECFLTFALVVDCIDRKDDVEEFWNANYAFVLLSFLPFLIGILLAFLWIYHLYLACVGVTTYEVVKWKDLHYLENKEKSPFSKGVWRNLAYFCRPWKEISHWKL